MSNDAGDGTEKPFPVKGIAVKPGPDGSIPSRRELRDLKENYSEQWSLYLLGLRAFQEVPDEKPLSYYKIAGIHGRPYEKWPDADWNDMKAAPGQEKVGFCTHTSVLFLPWHRPYLSLFEGELQKHVKAVAEKLPEGENKSHYLRAAEVFRMPYWDWAKKDGNDSQRSVFPEEALSPTIDVAVPGGNTMTLNPNPLYLYKFQKKNQEGSVSGHTTTVRYPAIKDADEKATKIQKDMLAYFNKKWPGNGPPKPHELPEKNLSERTLYILQSYLRFGPFSHNAFAAGHPEVYGSMEDIHNRVHTLSGGPKGNMSGIEHSAFDPVFWLHHTNIDRCFAIWQALHDEKLPEKYVERSEVLEDGTFTTPQSTTTKKSWEDKYTDLTPFYKDSNKFWNADGVQNTEVFGYAYPETQKWKFRDVESYKTDIKAQLKSLYRDGSLASMIQATQQGQAKSTMAVLEPRAIELAQKPLTTVKRKLEDLAPQKRYLEWLTNLKVQKHALNDTFNVHVFIGPIEEENPILWPVSPNHVGAFSVLGAPEDSGCAKCQEDRENRVEVSGQIPLTIALAERYLAEKIDDLTPASVRPYLQQNLHWRVALADGTEKPRGEVEDLLVSIISNEVTIPDDPDELPRYAETVEVYPRITTRPDGEARGDGTGLTNENQA